MKTVLWILVCLFFGIAAFEAALLVAITNRQDIEGRVKQIEQWIFYQPVRK